MLPGTRCNLDISATTFLRRTMDSMYTIHDFPGTRFPGIVQCIALGKLCSWTALLLLPKPRHDTRLFFNYYVMIPNSGLFSRLATKLPFLSCFVCCSCANKRPPHRRSVPTEDPWTLHSHGMIAARVSAGTVFRPSWRPAAYTIPQRQPPGRPR